MSEPTTQLATRQPTEAESEFALDQRKALMFASSPLVPEHLRNGGKETAIANCYIATILARQMNENPLVVMQNIYIVKGKAGWSSSYMIAKANASGKFKGGLRFRTEGKGDDMKVTCYAEHIDGGEPLSITVGMDMAKAEGWASNAKYRSMPEQMLRYRSAAFFVRTYCPEVMLGYQTAEEIEDTTAAEVQAKPRLTLAAVAQANVGPVETKAETITESGEVITVPAKPTAKPDMLDGLLAEIERRGGLETFYGQNGVDDEDIRNMTKGQRSVLCGKATALIATLKADAGEV